MIAAFDKGLPAARIALYPGMPGQRAETADELRLPSPLVRKILATFAIPIVEIDGEGADDSSRRSPRKPKRRSRTCSW